MEKVFNGGGRGLIVHIGLVGLLDEWDMMRDRFYHNCRHQPQCASIGTGVYTDLTLWNPDSKFMARVKDDLQSKVLVAMVEFVGATNVSTLISDVMLIRGAINVEACEAHIFSKTGLKITLKKKPFALSEAERRAGMPPKNSTGVDWGTIPCKNHTIEEMIEYTDSLGQKKRGLQPLVFKNGVKAIDVNGQCGIGKTTTIKATINALRIELGCEPKVLLPTCRRARHWRCWERTRMTEPFRFCGTTKRQN